MRLIQIEISLSSFKVRLALKLKELALPLEDPPGGSYRSEAFRAINPTGTIPTLVDGDFWLAESEAIIEYLDDVGAGRPLRPADPKEAARGRMVSRWMDFRIEPHVRRLFGQIAPAGRDAAVVREVDEALAEGFRVIEQGLDGNGPFACGARPGIADCGIFACMVWLEAMYDPLALRVRPGARLTRAVDALVRHPAVASDIADHRRSAAAWVASRLG